MDEMNKIYLYQDIDKFKNKRNAHPEESTCEGAETLVGLAWGGEKVVKRSPLFPKYSE